MSELVSLNRCGKFTSVTAVFWIVGLTALSCFETALIASLLALNSDYSARGVGLSDRVKVLPGVKIPAVITKYGGSLSSVAAFFL